MANRPTTPQDYYGYQPRLLLNQPVVIFGSPGTQVGRTTRAMHLLAGLPLVWVDRVLEHVVGMNVERLEAEQGVAARLEAERTLIAKELRPGKPKLYAVSHHTMTDPGLRTLLQGAQTVRLRATLPAMLAQIERDVSADAAKHWAIRSENGLDHETLKQALKRLEKRLPSGDYDILCAGRAPMEVASDILKLLGLPSP